MNVFEDLIVGLKEDNLIEDTVFEFNGVSVGSRRNAASKTDVRRAAASQNDNELRKKLAADEVSALQMVEHVISSVERDYLGVEPAAYDDLDAKKALHQFLHSQDPADSDAYFETESRLLALIDEWRAALNNRDEQITPDNLRRHCENCQPALSSQALFALARYYRGMMASETSRSKFDFVITRLFSKRNANDRREALFGKDETIRHLRDRFAEWDGQPAAVLAEDSPDSVLEILSFEDFVTEADNAEGFDELVKSDFFNRLVLFKECSQEQLSNARVAASAIASNIHIGNRIVELLEKLSGQNAAARFRKKYDPAIDQLISSAAARTIEIDDLLKGSEVVTLKASEPRTVPEPSPQNSTRPARANSVKAAAGAPRNRRITAPNKWLIIFGIMAICLSAAMYFGADYFTAPPASTEGVNVVEFDESPFKEYIKTSKLSGENMYCVLQPNWNALSKEEKEIFVQKLYSQGAQKGFKRLSLMNSEGVTVAYGSPQKVELTTP